jgi:1-carboxybiuret hydrolase subunit AtzH-like protein
MKIAWLATVLIFVGSAPLLAQQPNVPTTGLQIDLPEVVAEVKVAYDRYNEAINTGNIAILNATFRNDQRTIRYGNAGETQYGYKEIEAFRAVRSPTPPRTLSRTVITTYGRDFAVASTLTHRADRPGKVGRQMQTWVRLPEGWRVVAAHVSTIDVPPGGKP